MITPPDKTIVLQRDCPAHLIPVGTLLMLQKGQTVTITQALGGTYTVNVNGNLARIDSHDVDALGLTPEEPTEIKSVRERNAFLDETEVDEESVWEQLRTCYDPEIPVNIVELGLIYECEITPLPGGGNRAFIMMTLTAPGCGMGPVLLADVQKKVALVENVTEVDVQLVFDPPWDQTMMSEAAQLQLGML